MVELCGFCKKRNNSKFTECENEECRICKGASAKLERMIVEAVEKIPKGWKSFAISTEIPREMMAREEEIWDFGIGESVKNDFNKRIVSEIAKRTGMDYDVLKSDGKIIFKFAKNEIKIENSDIFIFGRYKKFRTDLAQTEWTCKNCNGKGCEECDFEGVKYESVEAIIGKNAKEIHKAKDAELHASGREDVDALNLAGRPFVLELRRPEMGKIDLQTLQERVNGANEGVEINDLRYASNSEVALVSDSHFDKAYEAEIEIENFEKNDLEKIASLKGAILEQRTPMRVKHRRSDIVRKRKILDLKIVEKAKLGTGDRKPGTLTLYILGEAGTYIKEFVSGDGGRTKPSVSGALGKDAKCIKLSVVEIYDEFLGDVLGENDA